MAKYLSIVEKAYRASVEEQDDTALWFTHAMKNGGADVTILLRGDAVNYAVKHQSGAGLKLGNRVVKGADIARDVKALLAKQVNVFAVADDLAERGINANHLVDGIETISIRGVTALVHDHDHVLHW
jgi:sulfur transfer complex TusBCD TusB component (DsrH family)